MDLLHVTSDTCTALSAVFPILLFTVLFNGRAVRPKYRRGRAYSWTVSLAVAFNLAGLITSILGIQNNGLNEGPSVVIWASFLVALLTLFVIVLLLASTFDKQDKNDRSVLGDIVHKFGSAGS